MVTSRDEHLAAVRADHAQIEQHLSSRIEAAMAAARESKQASFSVSMEGFPVGAYDAVLQPYREAGWTVTFSNDRNEHRLNFS
ncbi:MAG TPA: hypothetical protein VFT59_03170 [Candidatus Saccharimonadales bacterium]|nr:hypothetical protein [Candidatus Saccharimonadales bacterium]